MAALLGGLVAAQAIATLHVYGANIRLHDTVMMLRDAGYETVPNARTMALLLTVKPAVLGGLFFTLSVGACLSLLALLFCRQWLQRSGSGKRLIGVWAVVWAILLAALNADGANPWATLYAVAVPAAVVGVAAARRGRKGGSRSDDTRWSLALVPLLLLLGVWGSQWGTDDFLRLRDRLLLSRPAGIAVNDFYYRYTLYPAEAFKSLQQKLIKSCRLEFRHGAPADRMTTQRLLRNDYLIVSPDAGPVDLEMEIAAGTVRLKHHGAEVLTAGQDEFSAHPAALLQRYAVQLDVNRVFRFLVYISLFLGLPVLLYLFFFDLLAAALSMLISRRRAAGLAALLCLILGIGLYALWKGAGRVGVEGFDAAAALESDSLERRIAGLRAIEREGIEIGAIAAYRRLIDSPSIAERYWLARALGASRLPETEVLLRRYLKDSHPNVVCMALRSLGRRGEGNAAAPMLKILHDSEHGYVQWHAYKALKALGWAQTRFP
jgi:hypothetical protein